MEGDVGHYDTERLEAFICGLFGDGLAEAAIDQDQAGGPGDLPATYLPGTHSGVNYMSDLKCRLPSDRPRLDSLRPSEGEPPSTDAATNDRTIGEFYRGVWAKQAGGANKSAIGRYLRDYDKRVLPGLLGTSPIRPGRTRLS